ncbi:MAG: transposase [Candidatus Cloacimonetes bacterium]|nr:transposase [Candidatus Cloacimonadota bacterium]
MKPTRRSIRLPSYDYTSSGAYFVTICTKNRQYFFGKILNGKINLSKIGKIASQNWQNISNHYNHVELGEFVVMPNHIHGIIWIVGTRLDLPDKKETVGEYLGMPNNNNMISKIDNNAIRQGEPKTINTKRERIRQSEPLHKREFGAPQSGSLSMIINQYKASVKRWCNKNGCDYFCWQRNYYEHIIRNNDDLYNISEYIQTNPLNWEHDKEFKTE